MRLIDVDATKFRCRYDKVCSCDNKDKCKKCEYYVADFKTLHSQPLAYNVNEVVKQLEDEKEYAYANFEEYVRETCPWFDADYHDTFANGLVRAVEIIKKGNGENETK